MAGDTGNKAGYGGILAKLKLLFERNRLGELLVIKGLLTPGELRHALVYQKTDNAHLGRVLLQRQMITRRALYGTLAQQWTLRSFAAFVTFMVAFSSFGVKSARAGSIKDIPARISVAAGEPGYHSVSRYTSLFGSQEKRSGNLSPFTKWTGMFDRFERALNDPHGKRVVEKWQDDLRGFQGLPLRELAERVNDLANAQEYIIDKRNWGMSDYWETPVEFFTRGGDCEDFAIAKYASLRALGVPEDRMRIAIVHDMKKDIPHAVLVLYTDDDALILDNQIKQVRSSGDISHYRPIFTINRHAWWLHTKPGATPQIATAAR